MIIELTAVFSIRLGLGVGKAAAGVFCIEAY